MGNKLPKYANDKSHEELLHELCKMYKHTAETYRDPASFYKLGMLCFHSIIYSILIHMDTLLVLYLRLLLSVW